MGYQRRARVAARYPGLRVNDLSATDVAIYCAMIERTDAEDALRAGNLTPAGRGHAVGVLRGDKEAGQVAEAQAVLAEAMKTKGF